MSRVRLPFRIHGSFVLLSATACGGGEEGAVPAQDLLIPPTFMATQADLFSVPGAQPLAWADYDLDGDLDLALANNDPAGTHPLYVNGLPAARGARSLQVLILDGNGGWTRAGTKVTHIVQSGDTLWELSRKHNVGVRQLAKWNNMAPRDPLVPGTSLVIWSLKPAARTSIDPGIVYTPPKRSVTQRIGYKVRPGDSLALISRKFNVSVAQLVKWNKLDTSRYLQPGQRLTVYVEVTGTSTGT